jgi:hypothetical protein
VVIISDFEKLHAHRDSAQLRLEFSARLNRMHSVRPPTEPPDITTRLEQ